MMQNESLRFTNFHRNCERVEDRWLSLFKEALFASITYHIKHYRRSTVTSNVVVVAGVTSLGKIVATPANWWLISKTWYLMVVTALPYQLIPKMKTKRFHLDKNGETRIDVN